MAKEYMSDGPKSPEQPTQGGEAAKPADKVGWTDITNAKHPFGRLFGGRKQGQGAEAARPHETAEAKTGRKFGGVRAAAPETPPTVEKTPKKPQEISPESSIPGLSVADVELFEKHGITLDNLQAQQKNSDPEMFELQTKNKLEQFRSEKQAKEAKVLTPEELAEQKAKEEAARKERFEAGEKRLAQLAQGNEREKLLAVIGRENFEREFADLIKQSGGSGSGGGRGGGGPREPVGTPEGLPDPDYKNSLEYEASEERGWEIARKIVEQEALLRAGKIEKVDWQKLNDLYLDQQIHIEAQRLVKSTVRLEKPELASSETYEPQLVNPDKLKFAFNGVAFTSPEGLLKLLAERKISAVNLTEVSTYFAEAKRVGLFKDLDVVLASCYNTVRVGVGRGQTSAEINPHINGKLSEALASLAETMNYRQEMSIDGNIGLLAGVGELYVRLARGKLNDLLSTRDLDRADRYSYIENEFQLGQEDEDTPRETFWHLQNGWYIEITAQTEEEFQIAADSYISRLQSITSDAKKITQEASQFTDVLAKSEGAKRLLQTNPEFINTLTKSIEARVGVFGADDSNERYNAEDYKQFLDFINKDGKGPDRWLELVKLLDGKVAASLWALDKDPRWEMLFSLHGSRGQLASFSPAQRTRDGSGLYNQVYDLFVAEMAGVQIRNKTSIDELTKFMPDEQITNIFEGLVDSGKEIRDGRSPDAILKARYNELKDKDISELTLAEVKFVRVNRIQEELSEIRAKIARGEIKLQRKKNGLRETPIDYLQNAADRKFYKQVFEDTKKAVDIALQIYGTLGEKSKRGGGVFKTAKQKDAQGKEFQYFVPIHIAEKWVQCAETLTKMKYANLSAKERTAKVAQARKNNIEIFRKDGFAAKMVDADGRPMMLKRPVGTINPETGKMIVTGTDPIRVDFYTATHSIYGDWSGHTYWSYQEEDRHMLLADVTFDQARKIRDGELRPEDATMWAVQLLIIDPTLKRVKRLENFEDRERKLTAAAVEDSYQSHWRIGRELYRAFWPKLGTPAEDINIYYGLQDFGGFRKMNEHIRARIAEDPERFARRGRRLLPDIHNPIAPLSEYLGQGSTGSLGAIRMMDAPIYRGAGTFALDKFSAQAEVAGRVYGALIGTKDRDGLYQEGLLLKLTNNSDKLSGIIGKIPFVGKAWADAHTQNEFCYALMESLGRLQKYEQLLTVMETDIRNASGAFWLENEDIFIGDNDLNQDLERRLNQLPDISKEDLTRAQLADFMKKANDIILSKTAELEKMFNKAYIDENKSPSTGSGRHSAKIFHTNFGLLLVDEEKRGGVELYAGEKFPYSRIWDKIIRVSPTGRGGFIPTTESIWDFIFSKFVPT